MLHFGQKGLAPVEDWIRHDLTVSSKRDDPSKDIIGDHGILANEIEGLLMCIF